MLHGRLLDMHGGAAGLRDEALLLSAMSRPLHLFSYAANCADLAALAAAYTAGITRNHPFMDGNKRTAFVAGALFLELNGMRLVASEEEAAAAMLALASGAWDEATYAHFLRLNAKPGPDCPAPGSR